MSASTIHAGKSIGVGALKSGKTITWQRFKQRYLNREDAFKYEWVNGQVEKTPRSMDKSQLYILRNLLKHFRQLQSSQKMSGELISEPDLFFLNNHRRPAICWLSDRQIDALAEKDAYEIPAFVIEVISSNDQINRVKHKLNDYRNAGVQVVWRIFPAYKQV
ncbi:MAG TPA: Uma2 family endonuclease [Saprospiraceae bacterium]|nr:Uma2 family endonuclease [Saprospiraceae bacterium]HMQ85701.1 Uma2 family endonuclease [Saprospiraceae bacterium]